jgi:hypothetical protein
MSSGAIQPIVPRTTSILAKEHHYMVRWSVYSPFITAVLITLSFSANQVQAQPGIVVSETNLQTPATCTGTFVGHDLDHITQTSRPIVHFFESNGAGVAVGDLAGDGKIDIVLANLNGQNTILWNEGNFKFRKEILSDGSSRAVNVVDVDGDGRLDIVFTHSTGSISYWHNDGAKNDGTPHFSLIPVPDIRYPAYTMAWADVNGDGALDLVTASYDPDLERAFGSSFLFGDGAGVIYYEQHQGGFSSKRLIKTSQSLAMLLQDFRNDNHIDLLVGNDFGLGDPLWEYQNGAWVRINLLPTMTRDTMSLDLADINNDGRLDLFAADMKPYETNPAALKAWQFTLDSLQRKPSVPTIAENVLQVQQADGTFKNAALSFGVNATGWTWSSQFGDLDNDGYVDLYTVNGMRSIELFPQQPNNTLVEEHQAFHNDHGAKFIPAPDWKLNVTTDGRGMTMADLNNDGRLDIIVNNLNSPAQVFENQLCSGSALEVDLHWLTNLNSHALGAQLTLNTSTGTYIRQIRSNSGYLSGDPSRIHFGFPATSQLNSLVIRWPDGVISTIDKLNTQTLLTVSR